MTRWIKRDERRHSLSQFGYGRLNGSPAGVASLAAADTSSEAGGDLIATLQKDSDAAARLARLFDDLGSQMDACDELHAAIMVSGPDPELVERYVAAFNQYETTLEAYSAERARCATNSRDRV